MKINKYVFFVSTLCCVFVSSCGSGDDNNPQEGSLEKTSITLYVEETAHLTYSGGKCMWSSDNDLIAKVENGTVTGEHVGTTTIHANNAICTVTVKSKYNDFVEPYRVWGASIATVKNVMSSFTLQQQSLTLLMYEGLNKVDNYVYNFNITGLYYCTMVVNYSYNDALVRYLNDRYVLVSYDYDKLEGVMVSPDKSIWVVSSVNDSSIGIGYSNNHSESIDFTPFVQQGNRNTVDYVFR